MKPAGDDQPCTIYLLRHGTTDHNSAGRLMGHLDVGLAPQGEKEARAAAKSLRDRGISAIYSSDLQRAHMTALIVAEELRLPVVTHSELREIGMGVWEGKTPAEAARLDPVGFRSVEADPVNGRPTGGESEGEMIARLSRKLGAIADAHGGERVLVVSHGGPLRALVALVLGAGHLDRGTFAFANCGVLQLEWGPAGQRLTVPGPAA